MVGVSSEVRTVVLLGGVLAAVALVAWAAAQELSIQAQRADTATNVAEVAAWQVSQVLEDVRRITREAAEARLRGQLEA